jgi:predicted nucleotidyltransferase component of viral defense system
MSILSSLQIDFLRAFSRSRINDSFFLTGGTALSAFYLHHRYSEDIDLFTGHEQMVAHVTPVLQDIATQAGWHLNITKEFSTFIEAFITHATESIKVHFAQDAPFRLKGTARNEEYGINVDNELDIACNKLSALFDRYAEKDFVDIYFLSKEFMPLDRLFTEARKKHVGMDEYWLAVALKNVDKISVLPRMIKPITVKELQDFFHEQIYRLMDRTKSE